jgi:HSP20 family protein
MSLIKREPFDTFVPLRDAMNRLFEESFIGPRFELMMGRAFPLDVYKSPDKPQYIIEAALPGYKPEEIQIMAEGETLTIRVKNTGEEQVKKEHYVRRERYMGEMSRSVILPTTIDPELVEAVYEHGVLTLYVPKTEATKPQQIPVKVKEGVGV